jgi:hypothetical protein
MFNQQNFAQSSFGTKKSGFNFRFCYIGLLFRLGQVQYFTDLQEKPYQQLYS